MSCESFESSIALDAGGDLPTADTGALARHLETCTACRHFAAEMRESQEAVALLADAPLDEDILATVRSQVLRETGQGPATVSPRISPRVLALAATLAIAIGTLLLLRSDESDRPESTVSSSRLRTAEAPAPITQPTVTLPSTPPPIAEAETSIEESVSKSPQPGPPVTVSPEIRAASEIATVVTAPSASESMVIKLVSEDADLVIYWLVQPADEETEKETKDEISTV